MNINPDLFLSRRTIRRYSEKPVGDDLLNQLLESAVRSSTTGNMQLYSIIVNRSAEMKSKIAPFHFNQKMITEAQVVLTFCADFNRFTKWCLLRKAEPGYDNFLSFITAAIDAVIAAQTFCIAAEASGLGICYIGTVTYNASKLIEAYKLPKGVVPVATVTLGWPADSPEQVDRLPLNAVVHREVYSDYSDTDLEAIYSPKEAREDSRRFIAENNKETLAQVFTDVRYKKADNIHFSNQLLKVLQEQGFMNLQNNS
jgi:nitroreductase